MSTISGVNSASVQIPVQPAKVGTDSDGDNDGSKAAAPAAPAPFVAKPTATLGNKVNTTA